MDIINNSLLVANILRYNILSLQICEALEVEKYCALDESLDVSHDEAYLVQVPPIIGVISGLGFIFFDV